MAQFRDDNSRAQELSRAGRLTIRTVAPYIALMKWRNQLLALFCLILFAAFGVFYFQHWVVQKPFGIILFIGEGLTPGRLAATRVYAGGADESLSLDTMPHVALVRNYSNDFAAPDRAAAATAIATGVKTNNKAIGSDPSGAPLTNIMELARRAGRATGLVTDGSITNPTSAAFYAHTSEEAGPAEIARQLTEGDEIDLVLGGGAREFLPEAKDGNRKDGRDLLLETRRKGFDLVRSKAELEAVPDWRRPKLLGVFSPDELAFADQIEARSETPSLPDMVRRAIELLQYNRAGYLLVVDAGLMRKAAERNDGEHTLAEMVEFDRAVAMARRYAGANSTVVVCGDVAVGGLNLNGHPFRQDRGIAILGLNSAGEPWLSWASGPSGGKSYGAAKLTAPEATVSPPANLQEPAAFYAPRALNTVDDVVAFGSGPGAEILRGSIENTGLFEIIRDLL